MDYRKINLLHLTRYLILGILTAVCYYISTSLSDLYQTELNKNLKKEEKLFMNNPSGRLEAQINYIDKKEKFNHYVDCFFFAIVIGISLTIFTSRKIETENKRLDELEAETAGQNNIRAEQIKKEGEYEN